MKTTRIFEMWNKRGWIPVMLIASWSSVAFGHHSFAMFDQAKFQSQKGVIKDIQWTNPHVWVVLTVQENGESMTYSYEAAAVSVLKRVGWQKDSVKIGDKVTVVGHPYKDGRPGGSVDHLIMPDGQKLGTGDAIPGALTVPGVQ